MKRLLWIILFVLILTKICSAKLPHSWWELKTDSVVLQENSWDCGLASLNTLLSFYHKSPVTIPDREEGVSLLILSEILETEGLPSAGYRLTWENLEYYFTNGLAAPMIIQCLVPEPHFQVVLALIDHQLLVADPAVGTELIPATVFQDQWTGYSLVLLEEPPLDQVHYMIEEAKHRLRFIQERRF